MTKCGPRKLEMIINSTTRFERIMDSDTSRFTIKLPFFNSMNYLKYGNGANDLILLGGVNSYIIYK